MKFRLIYKELIKLHLFLSSLSQRVVRNTVDYYYISFTTQKFQHSELLNL